jgi:hypothetical protein
VVRGSRENGSALALRSSIFGGQLSTREEMRFSRKPVDWRDVVVEERRKQALHSIGVPTEKKKKRSLNEIAAEAVAVQAVGSESDRGGKEQLPMKRPKPRKPPGRKESEMMKQLRRKQHQHQQRDLHQQHQQRPSPEKPARPMMRGSFYGTDQPLPALVPVRQLPSYSDQTDVSDLIDDGSLSDDGEWAGEFTNLLGSYAAKDFSKVDRQRNLKMQATGEEIFEAEQRTLRLGVERDLEERRLLQLEAGKKPKRKKTQLVLID